MSAELVLHLELNRIEEVGGKQTFKDASGKKHSVETHGQVGLVQDATFGWCASFDGTVANYLSVPANDSLKINGDVTVEAWVYLSKEAANWVRIVGRGGAAHRSYGLFYLGPDFPTQAPCWLLQRSLAPHSEVRINTLSSPKLPKTWYHLAGVIEGPKGTLYLHDLQGNCIDVLQK